MNPPNYISWFIEEKSIIFEDGFPISCYRLDYVFEEDVYCQWALHLRQHYESDDELKESITKTGLSTAEYLRTYVIPQMEDVFGPSSRSNDFSEILVSDLLEFIQGYTVPRCKQRNRSGKTQSEHGTDIIAFKFAKSSVTPDINDKLLAVEVKAGLSSDKFDPIRNSIVDSQSYDEVRHSHTLNFYRKKLIGMNNKQQADEIARFQQKSEYDYMITFISAAVISRNQIENNIILGYRGDDFKLRHNNKVFLIHGEKLMDLAHTIFERCIK